MKDIKPKQSLGQNFLIDDNIARNIVRDLDIQANDVLIEIGPGKGALTKHLVGRAAYLFAIEFDQRVVEDLRSEFNSPDVAILHRDFLKVSLPNIRRKFKQKLRLVGNIPYHLTSSILFKAFKNHGVLTDITIMLQREVAQRIAAKPSTKEYGILAVLANFYGTPKIFFHVSRNCFYPRPKVESSVLRIAFHPQKLYRIDEKLFTLVVKTTFGKRRKTIRNGLQYLPYDKETLLAIIAMESDLMEKRPEQLTVAQFAGLAHHVERILNHKNH